MSEQKEMLKKVGETLLDDALVISVVIRPALPFLKPKTKTWQIRPLCMGSLIRISKLLLQIDVEMFTKGDLIQNSITAMSTHGDLLAEAIATAIVNRKKEPPRGLVKTIIKQFSAKDTANALAIVLRQMDVISFIRSISLVKGVNLLELSPMDQGRSIAPGVQSEE